MIHKFYTPGTLQPESFLIMGLNAKPDSTNPIGYFGTGLKYAIAVILRNGGTIKIDTPDYSAEFGYEQGTFRGIPYAKLVTELDGVRQQLPYTLDYGKDWEPWMAYRELYSNTLDENGSIEKPPAGPHSTITVDLSAFNDVVANFTNYFITEDWLAQHIVGNSLNGVKIFKHPTLRGAVFCKGIRVYHEPTSSEYCLYTDSHVKLTEDRTMLSTSSSIGQESFAEIVMNCNSSEFIKEQLLTTPMFYYYVSNWRSFSTTYAKMVQELYKAGEPLGSNVIDHAKNNNIISNEFTKTEYSTGFKNRLMEANEITSKLGFDITQYEHSNSEDAFGPGIGAIAHNKHIYFLENRLRNYDTKKLSAIMLEEMIHVKTGHGDCTRAMQSYLFEMLIERVNE